MHEASILCFHVRTRNTPLRRYNGAEQVKPLIHLTALDAFNVLANWEGDSGIATRTLYLAHNNSVIGEFMF